MDRRMSDQERHPMRPALPPYRPADRGLLGRSGPLWARPDRVAPLPGMLGWGDVRIGAAFQSVIARAKSVFGRSTSYGSSIWSGLLPGSRINFKSEAGDPMLNSAYVAVVNWIARNAPDAPLSMVREYDDGRTEKINPGPTSPGRLLRLWEKPNPWFAGPTMMKAVVVDLFSSGNGYVVKIRNAVGMVVELWWIPEWMMEPVWEGDEFISAYRQYVEGQTYYWSPGDVYHFRFGVDPHNPRKGLSPARSLLREIFTDNEASAFTASLLRNLGVPGVIIAPANTTGASIRGKAGAIKQQFKDTFGGDGRGEPMVLTAPTEVKVLSFNPQQMELRDIRKLPEERISAVLGVAAIVAGLGAGLDRSTFSNFGEARRAAYTESIIPLHRDMAATLENQSVDDFPDTGGDNTSEVDIFFDWRKATAMQESADALHKRALEAMSKGGITRAQFLRETDRPWEDQDEVFVLANNFTFIPKEQAGVPLPEPPADASAAIPAGPPDQGGFN